MNKHVIALAGVAVIVAAAGGAYFLTSGPFNGTATGNLVKDAFELSTGSDLEVMKVEDVGDSLKRVVLSDGDNVVNTHVTSDGQYIVQNLVHIKNYTETLEARNDFVSCLSDQNAQFYGILANNNQQLAQHTRMAQLQIQVLGGSNGLQDVFRGPGTAGFPQQQVLNNGLVWRLNGELSNGIKTVPQLEEATGCTYDAPGA